MGETHSTGKVGSIHRRFKEDSVVTYHLVYDYVIRTSYSMSTLTSSQTESTTNTMNLALHFCCSHIKAFPNQGFRPH